MRTLVTQRNHSAAVKKSEPRCFASLGYTAVCVNALAAVDDIPEAIEGKATGPRVAPLAKLPAILFRVHLWTCFALDAG